MVECGPTPARGPSRRVHILLLHQLFIRPDDPGGTRHFEFCQALVDFGHRVTIVAGRRSYLTGEIVSRLRREAVSPGLEIIRCGTLGGGQRSFFCRAIGFLWFTATSLAAGLRLGDVDLVWGTSPPLLQVASAWAIARLRGVPLVFEVRDLWPAFAIAAGVLRSPILIRLSEGLERFLYRRADHLIVNSPGFIPHLRYRGVADSKITLVPNGVDPAMFDPAGDGKEKPSLMGQAEAMGLDNVRFLPPVPKDDIPQVLAAADCGLAILKPLRLYATTYPNKVFNYMAAGRPVLLAIDGVIRQVIEEEQAGVAVAPGDPAALAAGVRRLAANPG